MSEIDFVKNFPFSFKIKCRELLVLAVILVLHLKAGIKLPKCTLHSGKSTSLHTADPSIELSYGVLWE